MQIQNSLNIQKNVNKCYEYEFKSKTLQKWKIENFNVPDHALTTFTVLNIDLN